MHVLLQKYIRIHKDRQEILFSCTHHYTGIPEIKTILGGYVIKGYLGGRVLLIKSVALVSMYACSFAICITI